MNKIILVCLVIFSFYELSDTRSIYHRRHYRRRPVTSDEVAPAQTDQADIIENDQSGQDEIPQAFDQEEQSHLMPLVDEDEMDFEEDQGDEQIAHAEIPSSMEEIHGEQQMVISPDMSQYRGGIIDSSALDIE
jgi:hypothetical protein